MFVYSELLWCEIHTCNSLWDQHHNNNSCSLLTCWTRQWYQVSWLLITTLMSVSHTPLIRAVFCINYSQKNVCETRHIQPMILVPLRAWATWAETYHLPACNDDIMELHKKRPCTVLASEIKSHLWIHCYIVSELRQWYFPLVTCRKILMWYVDAIRWTLHQNALWSMVA